MQHKLCEKKSLKLSKAPKTLQKDTNVGDFINKDVIAFLLTKGLGMSIRSHQPHPTQFIILDRSHS